MREILFKAKTCNSEWVQGYYCEGTCNSNCGISLIITDLNVEIPYRSVLASATDIENIRDFAIYEVAEDTICQYTGLKDKNGNKIWENDIVKCYADTDDLGNDLYFFYKVIWHEIYHCWWLSNIHTLEDEYLHQFNPSEIEVIGNIHDNPEILEGGDGNA